ncbi:MAG TPA: LacI family DNA-binding transcriptional regulator [Anaerolineaceae bacterium]|nr:LacI family DNA-binding transcriptional regulator [Anaerolineaceae bacterium]
MNVREIAKLAEVSPATVSLVLNDRRGVSQAVRDRVRDVIKANNYEKPAWAKKGSDARTIVFIKYSLHGMLVEENAGFIAAIIEGIEVECIEKGMHLGQFGCNENNLVQILDKLRNITVDGLVLLGTEMSPEVCKSFLSLGYPTVVVDSIMRELPVDTVVMANERIARRAVEYLYSLGHREIGYLQSKVEISNFKERERGFQDAMQSKGLTLKPENRIMITPTLSGACLDMEKAMMGRRQMPTAFFADNDIIALGSIKALVEAGCKIPSDISIIGIDDIIYAEMSNPPLTTMRIPRQFIGYLTVSRLLDRMNKPKTLPVHVAVGAELIKRQSTIAYHRPPHTK